MVWEHKSKLVGIDILGSTIHPKSEKIGRDFLSAQKIGEKNA